MISIIKNNWIRVLSKKQYLFISLFLAVASIFLATYFTTQFQVKGNIAFVMQTQNGAAPAINSPYINLTVLKDEPPLSSLISNKYDAIVVDKGNGDFSIKTIKNANFKEMIKSALSNTTDLDYKTTTPRGVGANILRFLIMFLLLQGFLYMFPFADDREQQQIKRISASPTSFTKYLLAQYLFVFLMIFIPVFIVIVLTKFIFGFNIGFGLGEYAVLIAILSAFGVAFSLFLNSLFKVADTAKMIGSSIVMLTSILAGSFSAFENDNKVFNLLIKILPQNSFLGFAEALENNSLDAGAIIKLSYVILLSVILFAIAIHLNKHEYICKKD